MSSFACALVLLATSDDLVAVHRHEPHPIVLSFWRHCPEGRPLLRGFRFPSLDPMAAMWPMWPMTDPPDAPLVKATALVQERLARDGLLPTTARVIELIGPEECLAAGGDDLLRTAGLPVDWLESFGPAPGSAEPTSVVRSIAAELARGKRAEELKDFLSTIPFSFRPSCPGFAVATESGEHEIGLVRLQLTSGTYWSGAGDGGCLDVARQLVTELPGADFVASVEAKHLDALLETMKPWPIARAGRVTVVAEPLAVSQWAQDNGKPGFAPSAPSTNGALQEIVTLAPRYPSRGEDGAAFVPGEAFALEGFASTGRRVVQSPLLFQGGNLIAIRDPKTGQRSLLIGEAELWRNTALGLTQPQVQDAFRAEFGVDRCIVLPAVSFHIDYEVSVRAVGDRLIAFVNDSEPAVRIVLTCGVDALRAAGVLDAPAAGEFSAHLEAGRYEAFMSAVGPVLAERAVAFGRFPETLAASFSRGPGDSGVGNFQRLLLAMDLATSWSVAPEALGPPLDPHSAAYLRSLQRRDAERRAVVADLERLGLEVVRIPSLAEGDRGINYVNGVHARGLYLMPAWGGLYAPLDRAAEAAFRRVLGDGVRVVPVLTGESQRRSGAIHCSVSVYPRG